MTTRNENTSNNEDTPLAVAEVLTDGQTSPQPQLELTKEALTMLFVPSSGAKKKDFQTLIKKLNPNYDN